MLAVSSSYEMCLISAKAACFVYSVKGVEAMKKNYGTVEEAKKVVEYLTTIDGYKKNENPLDVAAYVDCFYYR